MPGSVTTIGTERAIEGATNLVIYGPDHSAAQEYAKQNNIKFEIDNTLGASSGLDDGSKSSYVITLDGRDKKATQTVTVKAGEKLARPATPVLDGYVFAGWFKEDSCVNYYDFEHAAVWDDFTLYAGWCEDALYQRVPATDVLAAGSKDSFWIAKLDDYTYTGSAIKPAPQVYLKNAKLTSGVDYTVTYSSNTKAGTATVKVTGLGNFKNKISLKTNFTIKKRKISEAYVTKTFTNAYAASSKKKNPSLSLTVKCGSKTLKKNTDYKVAVYDESGNAVSKYYKAGTYVLRITGKGSFDSEDYCEKTFIVGSGTPVSKLTVAKINAKAYTGESGFKYEPEPTIKNGKKKLVKGVDYELSYKRNTEVGTAVMTITGMGTYFGTRQVNYSITGIPMNTVTYGGFTSSAVYTGEAITQNVTLTYNGSTLSASDYTIISCTKNVKAGKGVIRFKGNGKYTGVMSKSFTIKPYDLKLNNESRVTATFENGQDTITVPKESGGARPKLLVYDGKKLLTEGMDYTLVYSNNKKVGKASVSVKGKGNYKNSLTPSLKFTIEK